MAARALVQVVHWLRRVGAGPCAGTDAELLQRYATARDESAFAELLRRHGPLVWRICLQLLWNEQDAEDAFQATFLVLASKAASIRRAESLSGWLFGVARRTALLVRTRRPRLPEPDRSSTPEPDPAAIAVSAEQCDLILDCVRRLPEKYRLPLLLCGIQGLTKAEAAQQLDWKEGTVSGRLARGRQLLQLRLARRGILVPSGALLASGSATPGFVQASVLNAARFFVAPDSVATSFPSVIAREVLQTMKPVSWKVMVSVALLGLAIVTGGVAYYRSSAETTTASPYALEEPVPEGAPRWQERLRLRGYLGAATGDFSPDGRLFCTTDAKNIPQFLDTTTWKVRSCSELTKFKAQGPWPNLSGFSADGRFYALWYGIRGKGPKGKTLLETSLIEVATGKELTVLPGSMPEFCPGRSILATRLDNTVTLWDCTTKATVHKFEAGAEIKGCEFSPDGKLLAATTSSGHGKLWEVTTGKEIAGFEGFNLVWAKDSRTFATLLPIGRVIKLWDAATGKQRFTIGNFNLPGCYAAFSPDGRFALASGWDIGLKPNGDPDFPSPPRPYKSPKKVPLDLRLIDIFTGQERVRLPGKIQLGRVGSFSPDGKTVAYQRLTDGPGSNMEVVFPNMEVVLWDIAAGKERLVIRDKEGIDNVVFTPDGTYLVGSVGRNPRQLLRFWDTDTGKARSLMSDATWGWPTFAGDGKTMAVSVAMPTDDAILPPEGIATRMEMRLFQWTATPATLETRGEEVPYAKKPAEPKPLSEAAKLYGTLQKEHEAKEKAFAEQYQAAKSDEQRQSLADQHLAELAGFVERALGVARQHPKAPEAIDALEMALRCTNGGMSGRLGGLGKQAVAQVRQEHLESPALDRLVPWLQHHFTPAADDLLQLILEKSPHRTVRARAAYCLATGLAGRAEAARVVRLMPELGNHPQVKNRPEYFHLLETTDSEAVSRRAEKLFELIHAQYADIKQVDHQPATLGELSQQALFALRNLALGKTAPDIAGTDLAGKKFKLSDYRGKVVVLIFCGHWCGPCRQMNPHKQLLVNRYADKPFALLEVNSDDDADDWQDIMKKEGYTWRCWADGGKEGPIAKQWHVTGWPTIYVLDKKGVIRFKELRDEPLEKAVQSILRE
ncbi:MAG TPA: sigma-70 family RNA polymerase sigma factor [Gemmataceae bacterium]|nr:sigma-70 family RNA polymerase sigma factor [Gemmataceae bacterium]